ncbi:hypothetical protein ABK040_008439 [Willaertia magna]
MDNLLSTFLVIKRFENCQYWKYQMSSLYGTLYITPRFILFEEKTIINNNQNNNNAEHLNTTIIDEEIYTQLKPYKKSSSQCLILPLHEIQSVSKSSYLLKPVLYIKTKNKNNFYFLGLKSITNTVNFIQHILDQSQIHKLKSSQVMNYRKKKERPIELKLDENGFLSTIQYRKLDPFQYFQSLSPSSFLNLKSNVDNNSSNNKQSTTGYVLSGLYYYSIGSLVNLFTSTSKGEDNNYLINNNNGNKKLSEVLSDADNVVFEVLVKQLKYVKKQFKLDENGFFILNKDKKELFILYNNIIEISNINTFICKITYKVPNKETDSFEVKEMKVLSLYLPVILNVFLQENIEIAFLNNNSSEIIELDDELYEKLEEGNTSDFDEILNQESPELIDTNTLKGNNNNEDKEQIIN